MYSCIGGQEEDPRNKKDFYLKVNINQHIKEMSKKNHMMISFREEST